jgi:uncharacterized protein (UPF0548 family)
MLLLRKPSSETLERFLSAQSKLDFTYSAIGATAATPPAGYVVDRTRIKLGQGGDTFAEARAAINSWSQFRLGWVEAWQPDTPIQAGQVVAVVARLFGFWWVNACRIIYVVDEQAPVRRYGFAYGTLPDHAMSGEERFLVESAEDGSVWYDILAFSRPDHVLSRLGYPIARKMQRRFARDSAAAMLGAVSLGVD